MSDGPAFEGMERHGWFKRLAIVRVGNVDNVTPAIIYLASEESRYVTGW